MKPTPAPARYPEVDAVKGLAILLVVLGHAMCSHPIDLNAATPAWLSGAVRWAQMPLFFTASGFLFAARQPWGRLLRSKARRLLVPFLAFGLLYGLLRVAAGGLARHGGGSLASVLLDVAQGEPYWYLYVLLLMMLAVRAARRAWLVALLAAACVGASLLTDVMDVQVCQLGRLVYHFPYFCLGLLLRRYCPRPHSLPARLGWPLAAAAAALYAAAMALSTRTGSPLLVLYLPQLTGTAAAWCLAVAMSGRAAALGRRASAPLSGPSLLLSRAASLVGHFGRYSLQYYLNHLLLLVPAAHVVGLLRLPPMVQLAALFLLVLFASYVLLLAEQRWRPLRLAAAVPRR